MIFEETTLPDVYVINITPHLDHRGYFARHFCKSFQGFEIPQANISWNISKGTLRGLHYQKYPFEEDKIVSCLRGSIFDVAVDIRIGSPSYKKWIGVKLSADNLKMLWVPKGFAHGFQTLERNTLVHYYVSTAYEPNHEVTVKWDDPEIGIEWPIEDKILSEKDGGII